MNFVEEDMVHETYEVGADSTLIRIPNIRSIHNNENVCNNVNEPDRFHTILANIGEDDDVQLFSHFFTMIEESENNGIVARCLGCDKPYKAKSNVQSNLLKHLKVVFNFNFIWKTFSLDFLIDFYSFTNVINMDPFCFEA